MLRPYINFLSAANTFSIAKDKKSVNLALETSLLFDPKDARKDLYLISQFRRFLEKLEKAIDPQSDTEVSFKAFDGEVLTEFLTDLGAAILNLDNVYLQNLTRVLNKELKKANDDQASTFHKIFENPESKTFVLRIVNAWEQATPVDLKYMVNSTLQNKEDSKLTEFVAYLNELYSEKDYKKLQKLLRKLEKKDGEEDLVKQFLEFVFIDRYDNLKPSTRTKFHVKTKKLCDYFVRKFLRDPTASLVREPLNTKITFEDVQSRDSGSLEATDSEENSPNIKEIERNAIVINKDVVIDVDHTDMVEDTTETRLTIDEEHTDMVEDTTVNENGAKEVGNTQMRRNTKAGIDSRERIIESSVKDFFNKNVSTEILDIGDV